MKRKRASHEFRIITESRMLFITCCVSLVFGLVANIHIEADRNVNVVWFCHFSISARSKAKNIRLTYVYTRTHSLTCTDTVYSRFNLNCLNVILLKFFINMFPTLKLGATNFRLIEFQSKHCNMTLKHVLHFPKSSCKQHSVNFEMEFPKCHLYLSRYKMLL